MLPFHPSIVKHFPGSSGLVLVLLLGSCGWFAPEEELRVSRVRFPADGRSGGRIEYVGRPPNARLLGPLGDVAAIEVLERSASDVRFRSTLRPGRAVFVTTSGMLVVLRFVSGAVDLDEDGFPDAAELISEEDRTAFRRWFVRVAESQIVRQSFAWNPQERDCSGLIRFAYREALKRHDAAWQRRSGVVVDKNLSDVRRFQYPEIPHLGERLFRVADSGRGFAPADFAPFAEAEYLMRLNSRRVGVDLAEARPGDLLFYFNPEHAEAPYHSMIVVENSPAGVWIIYHTGSEAGLKRVPADYLLESPDPRWRPVPHNPAFQGVFRFLILE